MITILIYPSKTYNTTTTYMDRDDLHTYLSYGQNGAGIFIIEDNNYDVLNF